MKPDSGKTVSSWMQKDVSQFPAMTASQAADVCVVGAGIAGITCAYLLSKQGKSVVLVDDGPICGGETQRTTAHLASEMDDLYSDLEHMHGKEKARLIYDSHSSAINLIESISQLERIDCDFERVDGYLFLAPGMPKKIINEEYKAAKRAGFIDIEKLKVLPFSKDALCIRFGNQGQFHVLKYLDGLLRICIAQGVRIFGGTHVSEISGGAPPVVKTSEGLEVHCDSVIVATNSPVHGYSEFLKQAAYRTYVIAGRVPKGSVPHALYWDTLDPYHYVRLQKVDGDADYELLISGGEDHKTGQLSDTESCFVELEKWTRAYFPMMTQIEYRWSGQVYEPADGVAFIGRDPKNQNVYLATGDSGQGMTHGTIAGMLLTDLILGRQNPWEDVYKPSRKVFGAPMDFLMENMNTGFQYLRNIVVPTTPSVRKLARGEGMIEARGVDKVAIYKDKDGAIQEFSALCPHMGAVISWNTTEKSWDCPAHGSRFKATGEVIDGPANSDLSACKNCVHANSVSDFNGDVINVPNQEGEERKSA